MNRPSRGSRESATTTLKNGRFLAPPRESLITTMGCVLFTKPAILNSFYRWAQGAPASAEEVKGEREKVSNVTPQVRSASHMSREPTLDTWSVRRRFNG